MFANYGREGPCRLCSSHRQTHPLQLLPITLLLFCSVPPWVGYRIMRKVFLAIPEHLWHKADQLVLSSLFGFSGFWVTPGLFSESSPEGAQACADLPTSHSNTKSDKWVWKIRASWDLPQQLSPSSSQWLLWETWAWRKWRLFKFSALKQTIIRNDKQNLPFSSWQEAK